MIHELTSLIRVFLIHDEASRLCHVAREEEVSLISSARSSSDDRDKSTCPSPKIKSSLIKLSPNQMLPRTPTSI